jgi:hypothetical protein
MLRVLMMVGSFEETITITTEISPMHLTIPCEQMLESKRGTRFWR